MSISRVMLSLFGPQSSLQPQSVIGKTTLRSATEVANRQDVATNVVSNSNTVANSQQQATQDVATKVVKNSNTVVSPQEQAAIVQLINNARRDVAVPGANLQEVSWDDQLYSDLEAFRSQVGSEWFFSNSLGYDEPIPGLPGRHHSYNGYLLMNQPEFATYAQQGYDELFHDTMKNDPMAIADIIKFRANQKKCFKYSQCSPTTYSSYVTCRNPEYPLQLEPSTPCSWFFYYYGNMVRSDLNSVACVELGIPGPNTPTGQPNSFWCYGRYTKPTNSDQPYEAGPACSQCPTTAPKANSGLCTA